MAISSLISEAQKIIPDDLEIAHAWLDDLQVTHTLLSNPVMAIRFFMLGLHASGAIALDQWDDFDSLIAAKNPAAVH